MKSSYASIFRGFELQMCLNFDAFKCRVLNSLSNKTSSEKEEEVEVGENVGGRTAKSESQAQKYSKRSAAEKVHISRCHFLDFGNLAFKLGPRLGPGWKAANVLSAATTILWVYLWVWLCILIPCKLAELQSS